VTGTPLALNVYCWGDAEQDRLLTGCLGPAVRELWDEGKLTRFWTHRFDARGPHVMALLGAPAAARDEVRQRLSARLASYLDASPGGAHLSEDELRARHDACRGGTLCSLDALEGMAPNRSYAFADEPLAVFPFSHARTDEEGLLLGELALWCIERLAAGTAARDAVRWAAALDLALERAGAGPAGLWRFYASTLFPALSARIMEDDEEVAASLARRVGGRNQELFEAAWSRADAPAWPGIGRLAAIAAAHDAEGRWRFTRSLAHAVLAQLGLPVMHRIPLVVHAWLRRLPSARLQEVSA
jgi:hypothetical protein